MEYDKYNLRDEYVRDINNNLEINIPDNYFLDNKMIEQKGKGRATHFEWK